MTLFLFGLAAGIAASLGTLAILIALDKRQHPDCRECRTPLLPGSKDKLCHRCQEYAAMVKAGGAK